MQIRTFNAAELSELIQSPQYQNADFLPISRHRAISHLHNPALRPEDTLLLIAEENGKWLGYLGVLPVDIQLESLDLHTIGFLSCIWIDETARGKKVAEQLVKRALSNWKGQIAITEFTPVAERLYNKIGVFLPFQTLEGRRFYLKSDLQHILPRKSAKWQKVQKLLAWTDNTVNLAANQRLRFRKKPTLLYTLRPVSAISTEIKPLLHLRQQPYFSPPSLARLNWVKDFPWILSGDKHHPDVNRYYFSSVEPEFRFVALGMYDEANQIIAFVLLAKRNQEVKMPFAYYKKEDAPFLAELVIQQLLDWQTATLICFDVGLTAAFLQQKGWFLSHKTCYRHFMVSKELPDISFLQTTYIQDGDADCAFT